MSDKTEKPLASSVYAFDQYWDLASSYDELYDQLQHAKQNNHQPPEPELPITMHYVHAKDIEVDLNQDALIEGWLLPGQLSVVYGESNCGKTFFMTDVCFHYAMGREWRDRRTSKGVVVYVPMEGVTGLKKRVVAFRNHYGVNPDGFVMVPCHVDFMDPAGNINEFVGLLNKIKQEVGDIGLIVIDTLARAMSGGDENSGKDMGMLVKHADLIRANTSAHVCFVHHSGKDKLKGARGHSSLRAAVDTEIEVSREDDADFSLVRNVKQRDIERADDIAFKLKTIVLGQNEYNEDITSCVVEEYIAEKNKPKNTSLTAHEQFVYDCLLNAIIDRGIERSPGKGFDKQKCVDYLDLTEYLEQAGYKELYNKDGTSKTKDVTNAVRMSLRKKGYIGSNTRYIWVVDRE